MNHSRFANPAQLGLAFACLLIAACSNKPVEIKQNAVQDLRVNKQRVSPCTHRIQFIDKRSNADNLGNIGYRGFVFNDFTGWFERQVRTQMRDEQANESASPLIVELLQAYLESNRSTLSFNVVLQVSSHGSAPQIFRGDTTKMNWFGNDGELGAYIERASQSVLDKMHAAELCASAKPL
jgi:hypothetical protein